MKPSLQTPLPPMEIKRVDDAELSGYGGQRQSIAMTMIVKDALLRHYGSFKAAAYYMGQMDQGQLCRDLDSGKFKFERLELCDLAAKASVCRALADAFGQTDPKARRRAAIRNLRRAVDELDEAEDVA